MKRNNLLLSVLMLGLIGVGGIIFSPLAINAADTPVVQPEITETETERLEHPDWCDENHDGTHHNENHRTQEGRMRHHRNNGGRRCH